MSNILSEVHPELVAEWSDKNLPLTPYKITYGSNKVVWWKGACGHEWKTSVKARSNGENCPICSGARVIEGINDLATLKPALAAEWSSKNDPLKPTMVTIGSHKKVIWQDKYGHEWTATVKSRALNGTGCPYCSHNKILVGFNDLETLTAYRDDIAKIVNVADIFRIYTGNQKVYIQTHQGEYVILNATEWIARSLI